jgi:hypothetical protein
VQSERLWFIINSSRYRRILSFPLSHYPPIFGKHVDNRDWHLVLSQLFDNNGLTNSNEKKLTRSIASWRSGLKREREREIAECIRWKIVRFVGRIVEQSASDWILLNDRLRVKMVQTHEELATEDIFTTHHFFRLICWLFSLLIHSNSLPLLFESISRSKNNKSRWDQIRHLLVRNEDNENSIQEWKYTVNVLYRFPYSSLEIDVHSLSSVRHANSRQQSNPPLSITFMAFFVRLSFSLHFSAWNSMR